MPHLTLPVDGEPEHPPTGASDGPLLVLDELVILELPQPPSATLDALLGLDVALQLLFDGPRREVTLAD
jgi:hypothetical protein